VALHPVKAFFDKYLRAEPAGLAIIFLAGLCMLAVSWHKSCDPIIDFGHELYIPWAMSQGKVLYRDINMVLYGPLSYYVNATLFSLFGDHLSVIIGFNLFVVFLSACIIYLIIRSISNPLCAFFSTLSFVLLFAFPRHQIWGNFNFVTPYAHAATHGMFLALLALLLTAYYVKTRAPFFAYACWMVLGLTLLTKVEIFIGIFASMLFTWASIFYIEKLPWKVICGRLTTYMLLLIFPLVTFALLFSKVFSFTEAVAHIIHPYLLSISDGYPCNSFLIRVMGLDNPIPNLFDMFFGFSIYGAAALIIIGMNQLLNTLPADSSFKYLPKILAFTITIPVIGATMGGKIPYTEYFRGLPILIALYAIYLLCLVKTSEPDRCSENVLTRLALTIFAGVLLLRKFLNVDLLHYGFFLVLPGFLILVVTFIDELPRFMEGFSRNSSPGQIIVVVLMLCMMYSHVFSSVHFYSLVKEPIVTDQGTLKSFDLRYPGAGKIIETALNRISDVVARDETFTVVPEGLMFNYLTRRYSPIPYLSFVPPFLSMFGGKVLGSLQKSPPDYVVIVERPTIEYGRAYQYFGTDYGRKIYQWIESSYQDIARIGEKPLTGKGFGIRIMKKQSSKT
jgi:4-amino-4-deoxy-L-arabinose transferase-like glycosyltransferase